MPTILFRIYLITEHKKFLSQNSEENTTWDTQPEMGGILK
jgi:hypothetical protein